MKSRSIAVLLFVGSLVVVAPIVIVGSMIHRSIRAPRDRVLHELDHAAIRVAALDLLSSNSNGLVDKSRWPEPIVTVKPSSVTMTDGSIVLEFGGGFGHYGLIVDPKRNHLLNRGDGTRDAYIKVVDLGNDLTYYECE
ncbi:hypothetical protein FYK55_26840 [Roseiconus nitratireducens]|uniref:Uncharacterized protein n=1 Tax=Roseiconus nitratireducens TaxID=2605748 RepID=A0A5M6CXB5_9BACT|nr:hypothetical protein FYK55_26840 [Roseiconus nitratireducens]